VLDPDRLRAYNIPHGKVIDAVQKANQETGGSCLSSVKRSTWCVHREYLKTLDDFRQIPLMTTDAGVPVRLETWRGSKSVPKCGAASPS